MNEIQIFANSEFGEVGVILIDDKPYFPATECAKLLGYTNPRDAMYRHCKGVVKRDTLETNTNRHGTITQQTVEKSYIPEGDLYRLIARSKLPAAERFERWVFDEVVPAVRKHGGYLTDEKIEEVLSDPDTIIRLATDLKRERAARLAEEARRRELEGKVEADAPKVLFADSVAASKQGILVGTLAKLLAQNGLKIGQNRLFARLRDDGLLHKGGSQKNLPTQYAMEQGWFEIKERSISNPDGTVRLTQTPLVTGKGQVYLIGKYTEQLTMA